MPERSTEQDKQIAATIRTWAKHHPEPNAPAISLGPNEYTPVEIAYNVTKRRSVGRLHLSAVKNLLEAYPDLTVEQLFNPPAKN